MTRINIISYALIIAFVIVPKVLEIWIQRNIYHYTLIALDYHHHIITVIVDWLITVQGVDYVQAIV